MIGATIVWSAVHDYIQMIQAGRAGLDDILLLFIYLELGTIVGVYFKPIVAGALPARRRQRSRAFSRSTSRTSPLIAFSR